jgi:hypothetical protein
MHSRSLKKPTVQWNKLTIFHVSYSTVMHCHPLFVSLAIVLTLIFAIGLVETIPTDWTHSKKLLLALFYLFWAGYITTVYCY